MPVSQRGSRRCRSEQGRTRSGLPNTSGVSAAAPSAAPRPALGKTGKIHSTLQITRSIALRRIYFIKFYLYKIKNCILPVKASRLSLFNMQSIYPTQSVAGSLFKSVHCSHDHHQGTRSLPESGLKITTFEVKQDTRHAKTSSFQLYKL